MSASGDEVTLPADDTHLHDASKTSRPEELLSIKSEHY